MTPGVIVDARTRTVDERIGRVGLALVYVGIAMLFACIVLRGLATTRVPWGNMYEFINLTSFCGLIAAAVVLRKPQFRALWVFVLVPELILLAVSGKWLYTNAAPVMPALQSYWLPIHVSVVSIGSGVFLVAGVASILFLLKMSPLGEPRTRGGNGGEVNGFRRIVQRLPDAQTLDRIAYPDHHLRVPDLRVRRHLRGHLGRGGLGPLLGLGPQGDGVVRRLGGLRRVPARPVHRRLAGQEGRVDQRRRLRRDGVQPVLHQPGDRRPAFVRRGRLSLVSFRAQGRFTDPAHPAAAAKPAAAPSGPLDVVPEVAPAAPLKPTKPRSLDPATVALLSRPSRAPSGGWRKLVYYASGTLLNPGESPKTLRRTRLTAQINQPLRDCYRIAVLSLKGGWARPPSPRRWVRRSRRSAATG